MGSQSLGDILGQEPLEGESATRAQPLEGEEQLNSEGEAGAEGEPEKKAASDEAEGEKPAADDSSTGEEGAPPAPEQKAKSDDEDDDPHPVPRKVLQEERKKRQEAEQERLELARQIAELKGQLSVYSKQGQQPQKDGKPDQPTWEDQYYADPAGATERAIQEAVRQANTQTQTQTTAMRMEISEEIMRSQTEDFDEVLGEFISAAKESPELQTKLRQHPHPAKFAYDYAKTQRELKDVGSIDDLKAKLRQEVRAEVEKEFREKSVEQDAAKVSTSSAGARSAGTSPVARVLEDIPMSDILAG